MSYSSVPCSIEAMSSKPAVDAGVYASLVPFCACQYAW